jgi:hypothetical protein
MTLPSEYTARPGAHNQIEGAPPESLDFVREMGDDEGWQPVFKDGEMTEEFRASLRAYADAELENIEVDGKPMTSEQEQALAKVQREAFEAYAEERSRTFLVRFTRPPGRKGDPRYALETILGGISKAIFEWEILDA